MDIAPLQNTPSSVADNSSLFAIFAEPNSAVVAAQPPPNVMLKGVLLAIPERLSSALLEVNGKVKNYRIGESLQDSGYTLVVVDWNAVVIADGAGKQSVINIVDAMPLDQRDLAANAIRNRRSSNTFNNDSINSTWPQPTDIANANSNANNAANNTHNNANSSNPTSAIDGAVSGLQQNPANYLSSVGLMASSEGYQMTTATPSALRNRLGLEPGDRLMSVNGQKVGNNPSQDANILQQAQKSGEAQIEVKRGEQVITIRQPF